MKTKSKVERYTHIYVSVTYVSVLLISKRQTEEKHLSKCDENIEAIFEKHNTLSRRLTCHSHTYSQNAIRGKIIRTFKKRKHENVSPFQVDV